MRSWQRAASQRLHDERRHDKAEQRNHDAGRIGAPAWAPLFVCPQLFPKRLQPVISYPGIVPLLRTSNAENAAP